MNYNNLEFIFFVVVSILCGCGIRASLSLAQQKWATTYHQTMSYLMLPAITMVITTLISGNIALSLGMIGALSIVRFRNPVKNPFELVIFFALITIGIGNAIDFKFGVGLTIISMILIIIVKKIEIFFNKKNKSLFSLSFEEGVMLNELIVKSSKQILFLESNNNLTQFYYTKDNNKYNYNMSFVNKNDLEFVKKKLENADYIDEILVRYA